MPELDAAGVGYGTTLTPYTTQVWEMTIQGVPYDVSFFAGDGDEMWLRNRLFVGHRTGVAGPPPPLPSVSPAVRAERLRDALHRARFLSVPQTLGGLRP